MAELLLPTEATIEQRFDCYDQSFLQTDFEGFDILSTIRYILLFQMTYLHMKGKDTDESVSSIELVLHCELSDAE